MADMLGTFHFSQPGWLWLLLLVVPVAIWLLVFRYLAGGNERIQRYADTHLLPHLLGRTTASSRTQWRRYAGWTGLWVLLVLAMAGPRWDFTDVQLFRPGTNLIVLLDLSQSMQVQDVAPSRLARARQEVADLLDQNRGVRVGLIGFATIAHVVSPITEDMQGVRRVLSALDSDLVRLRGSRLMFALDRAEEMIASQPRTSVTTLLLISDGDFEESGLEQRLADLAVRGHRLHVLGVGTPDGDAVPAGGNQPWLVNRSGQPVISSLNEGLLRSLARAGNGIYQRADYRERDTGRILAEVRAQALPEEGREERTRVWNERYYLLAGLALLLLLPLFRRTLPGYRPRQS
jgi:Ca-activated chloride channel family protein